MQPSNLDLSGQRGSARIHEPFLFKALLRMFPIYTLICYDIFVLVSHLSASVGCARLHQHGWEVVLVDVGGQPDLS